MVHWNGNDVTGWSWFAMSLGMVLFGALLIAAVVLLFRMVNRGHADAQTGVAPRTPEDVLAERFARGDIDEEEYRRRLDVLRKGP